MGRLIIARGPAENGDTRAWAHRVSIKKMSPEPEIEFSRGRGQLVKAFLLQWNVDLKNRSFKTVDQKIFKQVSGSYLRSKASPNMLFWYTFFMTLSL
jgi:hypothetical protein